MEYLLLDLDIIFDQMTLIGKIHPLGADQPFVTTQKPGLLYPSPSIYLPDLDPEFVKSELELIKSMLKEDPKNKNKPDNILEMIVQGRKGKILADVCLLDQEYVKEKMSIKELIDSVAKEAGTKISVKKFVRYQIG